jgi:GTPase SAR1 family protein
LFRIDDWIRDLNENCPNAKKIIVANKIDLLAEDVDSKLLEQFLQKVDYPE